jgi:hypothetical protein
MMSVREAPERQARTQALQEGRCRRGAAEGALQKGPLPTRTLREGVGFGVRAGFLSPAGNLPRLR